ncbi:MAG TPA: hypothetical protein VJB90_01710 [Candidatus Nanoarchaeia archaeon]|nr:hypothetical protein [Candidatus Woesearchaeota archaeon]HLD18703.1 hypothetical protein [Candidatus Nanoarchaeia archaeon]
MRISAKGQAAMEFLMTYGWAILVVLAAIAALAYFGVLSPAKFLPEKCILEPGFLCEGHKVETNKVTLIISNTVEGRNIIVNSIIVGSCSGTFNTELVGGGSSSNFPITGGDCNNGAVKERYKGDITIGYTEKNTNLTKTMYGNLNSKVEG